MKYFLISSFVVLLSFSSCLTSIDQPDYGDVAVGFVNVDGGDNSTFGIAEEGTASNVVTINVAWTGLMPDDGTVLITTDAPYNAANPNQPNQPGQVRISGLETSAFGDELELRVPQFTDLEEQTRPEGASFTVTVPNDELATDDQDYTFEIVDVRGGFDFIISPTFRLQVIDDDIPPSVAGVREFWNGVDTNPVIEPGFTFTAVVTSDASTENLNASALFFEDATAGIGVFVNGGHNFQLGDEIVYVASETATLSEFNDLLQINDEASAFTVVGTVDELPLKEVTIAEMNEVDEFGFSVFQGQRVLIRDVTFLNGGTGTWDAGQEFSDATGSTQTFIRSSATFAGEPIPAGVVDVIGVVSQFRQTPQLYLRSPEDIN